MPVTNYIWHGDNILMEKDDSGQTTAEYSYNPGTYGELISQRRWDGANWQTRVHHYDALGSTRALTDDSGAETDSYTYDAWGNEIAPASMFENPFRWVGRVGYYWDQELGTYYIRARTYQAVTGQFLSVDPAKADVNTYRYVENGPMNGSDPTGLAATGTFDLEVKTVKVNDPAQQVKLGPSTTGYTLDYTAAAGTCSGKIDKVTLTQALTVDGFAAKVNGADIPAHFDNHDHRENNGLSYPVYKGQKPNGDKSLGDAPYNTHSLVQRTYKITVCAICTSDPECAPPKQEVLGCISFQWVDREENGVPKKVIFNGADFVRGKSKKAIPAADPAYPWNDAETASKKELGQ